MDSGDSRRSDWTTTLPGHHRYDGLLKAYDDARAAKVAHTSAVCLFRAGGTSIQSQLQRKPVGF